MLMVNVLMTSTTMELLPLVCLCLLTRCGSTFADGSGPSVLVAVEEGRDAILPCSLSTKENIEKDVFDWKKDGQKEVFLYVAGSYYGKGRTGQDEQLKGRVFHFEDELKNGNASIKITNTEMADNGSYTCTFPNFQQTSHIKLIVGAVSKPSFKILGRTKDGVWLQCEVSGTSSGFRLNMSWWDSSGTKLTDKEIQDTERGASYILQTTVSKSGNYCCVATQKELYHRVYTETYVPVPGDEKSNGLSTSTVVVIVIICVVVGLLIVFALGFALAKKKYSRTGSGDNSREEQNGRAGEGLPLSTQQVVNE